MDTKTDPEKELTRHRFMLGFGKIIQIVAFATISLLLYRATIEIQAHPGTFVEAWRSKPSLIASPLLLAILLIMPFYMVNSHNLTKIRIDHFEDLKAKEEGIERERRVRDGKIEMVVRNASKITAAFMTLILVPIVIGIFGFLEALVSGKEYSTQELILIPAILAAGLALLAFYRIDVKKEDMEVLSWRESEKNKLETAEAEQNIGKGD